MNAVENCRLSQVHNYNKSNIATVVSKFQPFLVIQRKKQDKKNNENFAKKHMFTDLTPSTSTNPRYNTSGIKLIAQCVWILPQSHATTATRSKHRRATSLIARFSPLQQQQDESTTKKTLIPPKQSQNQDKISHLITFSPPTTTAKNPALNVKRHAKISIS